jgi:hypothetical protein
VFLAWFCVRGTQLTSDCLYSLSSLQKTTDPSITSHGSGAVRAHPARSAGHHRQHLCVAAPGAIFHCHCWLKCVKRASCLRSHTCHTPSLFFLSPRETIRAARIHRAHQLPLQTFTCPCSRLSCGHADTCGPRRCRTDAGNQGGLVAPLRYEG